MTRFKAHAMKRFHDRLYYRVHAITLFITAGQALLYKFAGRWDHVTRNTLTNQFLKPGGTYEED